MTRTHTVFALAAVWLCSAATALAQDSIRVAPGYELSPTPEVPYLAQENEATPSPSDRILVDSAPSVADELAAAGCGGCRPFGGCDGPLCFSDAELWELFPETCRGLKIGGWVQAGYNNKDDGKFNTHPGKVNVHQTYLYAEKVADGSCGLDWGFRTDIVYGVDAQDAQAFGNYPGTYDYRNGFDHGIYGWAFPQLYAELAYHDLSVKLGRFYRLAGYESVMAPNNFFYSHSFTMYNSEPFTHTGALASYRVNDRLTAHGGWTLGWDTGFEQYAESSNFLGGMSYAATENVSVIYICTAGDLGWRGDGYSHSLIFDVAVSERMKYVLQSDLVGTTGLYDEDDVFQPGVGDDIGVNQYLFYELTDCWKLGGRLEWWQRDGSSLWEATAGANWRPHPNFVLRPEIRYNWGSELVDLGLEPQTWNFGIDGIVTF